MNPPHYICMACSKAATFRCTRCEIAYYCCRSCQNNDYSNHKGTCVIVGKSMKKIYSAAEELSSVHPDVFLTHVGDFWELPETRHYMIAHLEHIAMLSKLNTVYSLHEATLHGRFMLWLNSADDLQVRNLMPALYLRLNSHQAIRECHRFICVWNCPAFERTNAMFFSNISCLPDMPEETIFESVPCGLFNEMGNVYHTVAMTMIKIKLCAEATSFALELTCLLCSTIRSTTRITLLRGDQLILTNVAEFLRPRFATFKTLSFGSLVEAAADLNDQVTELLHAGESQNPLIWKALLNPQKALRAPLPTAPSPGSAAEAVHVVREYAQLLYNTEGTLQKHVRSTLAAYVGGDTDYVV